MESQIVFIIASLCLWHQAFSTISIDLTPSTAVADMSATPAESSYATPEVAASTTVANIAATSSSVIPMLPPILPQTTSSYVAPVVAATSTPAAAVAAATSSSVIPMLPPILPQTSSSYVAPVVAATSTPAAAAAAASTSSSVIPVLPPLGGQTSSSYVAPVVAATTTAATATSTAGNVVAGVSSTGAPAAVQASASVAASVAASMATNGSAASQNTVNPTAITPSSTAGSGSPATTIVAAWNAWVNQNCKSMCCGGLSSNKKYQENRTCSNANINLCPSDAHGRNLTRDKDCPTCVNGDCSFSPPGNDAPNAKPWTVLLFSIFMVALGFVFAH